MSQPLTSIPQPAGQALPPTGRALPPLTPSSRGSWYQAPHVCIPASSPTGPLLVLIDHDAWQRALRAAGGDVREATLATFRHAERTGNWMPDYGERAIMVR